MVMDYLRSCYSTDMQFDEAGLIVHKVRWYWCEPGAKLFPGRNSFSSDNWSPINNSTLGLGEVWNSPRPWSNGSLSVPPPPGDGHVCGDLSWFSEGCPSDAPPLPRSPSGLATCCSTGGIVISGGYKYLFGGGLALGGDYIYTPPPACQPYNPAHYSSTTFTQQTGSLLWHQFGSGPTNIFAYDPAFGVLGPSSVVISSNGVICSSSLQGTVVFYYYTTTGFVGAMTLQSYNSTTHVGTYKMPATSPNYAGQLFDFYMLP